MIKYLTRLSLLAFIIPLMTQAQLHHFPHNQEILFKVGNSHIRATFDSTLYDTLGKHFPEVGLGYKLWENERIRPPYCLQMIFTFPDASSRFGMGDFAFDWTADSLFVYGSESKELIRVNRSPKLGQEMKVGNTNYKITDRRWENHSSGADSIWEISEWAGSAPVSGGKQFVIGDELGWLAFGDNRKKVEQVEQIHQGMVGSNYPSWQDFFPEEPGDMKQFRKYAGPWIWHSGIDKGYLDSFVAVTRYTDSIIRSIKRWRLDSNYNWLPAYVFDEKIFPTSFTHKRVSIATDPKRFANPFLMGIEDDSSVELARYDYFPAENEWTLSFHGDGYRYISTGNFNGYLQYIYDYSRSYKYSTLWGEVAQDAYSYSWWGHELVGARVGGKSMGKLNLGMHDLKMDHIRVYPNPTSSSWKVGGLVDGTHTYTLQDVSGVMVQQGELIDAEIQGDGLLPGIYYLRLQVGDTVISRKLVHH